jgi:hypothetical protein
MKPIVALCLITAVGCGQKREGLPFGTTADGSEEGSDEEAPTEEDPAIDCVDVWGIEEDGISIQAETCLAWSPLSLDTMDWYEAASTEEGELGGCGTDCPDGVGYCAALDLGGRMDWRLPSFDELKEGAMSDPNIPDMDAKLWSRDTGSGTAGNAWVVNLNRAGFWVELNKDDAGISVRCVSDS